MIVVYAYMAGFCSAGAVICLSMNQWAAMTLFLIGAIGMGYKAVKT